VSRCAWSTSFQSLPFVTTWYDVYRGRYEPVLALERAGESLTALLPLALEREGRAVVCAGSHHAEYPAWMLAGSDADAFLNAVLDQVRALGAQGSLRFDYLPPGVPVPGFARGGGAARGVVRTVKRPLMDVRSPEIAESLRKKSNKSRLSRLKRIGPVRLQQFQTAADLDRVFGAIITQCDLRQGSMHHGTPFRDDPLKRELFLRFMDQPGLMHATALMAGDTVLASNIGFVNGTAVTLGLITHSPLHAGDSPGKLLVLLLGQLLAEQGFATFDLTPPGGDYKDRYATGFDEVQAAELFLDRADALPYQVRQLARNTAKRMVAPLGITRETIGPRLERVRSRLSRGRLWELPSSAVRIGVRRGWSTSEYLIYRASPIPARTSALTVSFAKNQLEDLLLYQPSTTSDPPQWEFWSTALSRLEEGQVVYTLAEAGRLVHHSWLIPATNEIGTDYGHRITIAEKSAVLWDDVTHPVARGRGIHQESILARMEDARVAGASGAYAGVRADNGPSRHNYEKLGFVACCVARAEFRLGKVSLSVDGSCA